MDRWLRTERHEAAPVDGGAVLLHLDRDTAYSLNAVGACVWERLAEPCTLHEVCGAVASRFEVDAGRCEADVIELLADLERSGLALRLPA